MQPPGSEVEADLRVLFAGPDDLRTSFMRAGYRLNDRQAESGPGIAPARIELTESLERLLFESRGKARPLVADAQSEPLVITLRSEENPALPVAERIIDEIAERLLDPHRVEFVAANAAGAELQRSASRGGR